MPPRLLTFLNAPTKVQCVVAGCGDGRSHFSRNALRDTLRPGETTDCEKGKIALAIEDICHDQQGRAALIAVGACGVLVKVLNISDTEETRRYISRATFNLARDDEGRLALVAAGACEAATHALRSAASDDAKAWISHAIHNLAIDGEGRLALMAAGALRA